MSNFTPLVKRKFTFEGDEVEVVFSRLKRKHIFKLIPQIVSLKKEIGDSDIQDAPLDDKLDLVMAVAEGIGDKAKDYIRSMTGLKDLEGNEVSIDEVMENSYFSDLYLEIVMAMIDSSIGLSGKASGS